MICEVVQRWRGGRDSYRPAREVVNVRELDVDAIADDRTARAFVREHHYSGSYPAARFRFGLRSRGELVGVAVFSQPINDATLACLPGDALERVELGRFVLLDQVGANAETWFIARCFEALRRAGMVGVVSFADPQPRHGADGAVVFPGHVGTIYQAANGRYLGRSKPDTLRLFSDGRCLHRRARQKVLSGTRGWRYVAALLEQYGAAPIVAGEDLRTWAQRWIAALTVEQRHGGNHKYAWGLSAAAARHLPSTLPYPKFALDARERVA